MLPVELDRKVLKGTQVLRVIPEQEVFRGFPVLMVLQVQEALKDLRETQAQPVLQEKMAHKVHKG